MPHRLLELVASWGISFGGGSGHVHMKGREGAHGLCIGVQLNAWLLGQYSSTRLGIDLHSKIHLQVLAARL